MAERDQHADHIDSYVASARVEEAKLTITFVHCLRSMVEVPMAVMASLPPHATTQGIAARIVCANPLCKAAFRVQIMPENGA